MQVRWILQELISSSSENEIHYSYIYILYLTTTASPKDNELIYIISSNISLKNWERRWSHVSWYCTSHVIKLQWHQWMINNSHQSMTMTDLPKIYAHIHTCCVWFICVVYIAFAIHYILNIIEQILCLVIFDLPVSFGSRQSRFFLEHYGKYTLEISPKVIRPVTRLCHWISWWTFCIK